MGTRQNLNMQKLKPVGLSGFATVGKDLFFSMLSQEYPAVRFSLADILKTEMRNDLLEETAIDIFNCTQEDKETLRPMLVKYAIAKRKETEGRYFTDRLSSVLNNTFTLSKIPVITDIRYCEYPKDEVSWLKDELGGVLVHIEKYKIINNKRKYVSAPNEDEKRNDPFLRENADYVVDWEESNAPTIEEVEKSLRPHIKKFIDWYKNIL